MAVRMLTLMILILSLKAQAEDGLKKVYDLLEQTKLGDLELQKARDLKISIEQGTVSKTDVTATRLATGAREIYQFNTKVIVDQSKDVVFQALDLAHELTHATSAQNNPFDPELTALTYIEYGIESAGGEAQAIANECEVGKQLIDAKALVNVKQIQSRCQFVWVTLSHPDEWKKSFYFMGQYYREFMKQVLSLNGSEAAQAEWLKKIDPKNPVFASAVAHKPYPLALLQEYVTITHKVCERAQKSGAGRQPAQVMQLKERCAAIGTEIN